MKILKLLSIFVSILLGVMLFLQWNSLHTTYTPNTNQLDSNLKVEQFLDNHFKENTQVDFTSLHKSAIGMYIESLLFLTANDIEVSGHVWQKIYLKDKQEIEPGIVFIDAIGDVTLEKRYTKVYDTYELHGWYFEANLRQAFQYSDYPIDHKTVWIKVKPVGFDLEHIFTPDLASYEKTSTEDSFGISQDIVLLGWEINESFFDYMPTMYDTNFGLKNNKNHFKLPVLAFNIVINRKLINAFMINITLLLSTMLLLYILILMITSDDSLKEEFDISVGTTVSTCGGLFFAVLLAHIHLREQFASSGFVYIEFFYILNYLFITISALVIFSFYNKKKSKQLFFFKNDAIFVKLLYWPLYLGSADLYTFLHFYT